MKSWFQDDRHYDQQITRKTDRVEKCVEGCNHLREAHGWSCVHKSNVICLNVTSKATKAS